MSTVGGGGGDSNNLITVHPDELRFIFEVDKQSFCDLKVVNNTERHVAFKVKTTSPKKYFVRPNTGVIQPWDSCVIRVTLQAQRESPPDMQCKDKFLLLSTTVPQHTDMDELPLDTFTKDSNGRIVGECKLRVLYIPPSAQENGEDDALASPNQSFDGNFNMQRLKDERDSAMRQTQQLQQELDLIKRRDYQKTSSGFSIKFALIVALICFMLGILMKWSMSSPAADLTEVLTPPEVLTPSEI